MRMFDVNTEAQFFQDTTFGFDNLRFQRNVIGVKNNWGYWPEQQTKQNEITIL